jgi:hypothetical protein
VAAFSLQTGGYGMKIMDLLDDVFFESVEISPVLAQISPALAHRKSPETGHLSPISPFSPTPTVIPIESGEEKDSTPPPASLQTEPVSCFSCAHYDGKGAAWPGMCRYFETIGQAAKEIDFNVIDPVTGCKCYMARAFTPELVSSITRQRLHGDDPGYVLLDSSKKEIRAKQVERISIVAAAWLNENKVQLRLHDWTMAELYRRNLSRGIAWSPVWSMFGLTITIEGTGCICFEYSTTTGQKIRQTAFPKRSPSKRRLDS